MAKKEVSAIVCAYNEGPRISNVLNSLLKSKNISEIIVIDDGSTDDTKEQVMKFKKIKYFKNNKNKGKGYSMDIGVKKAKHNLIFFCDADLRKFNKKIVDKIIEPVLKGKADMSIGLRKRASYNFMIKFKKLSLPFMISGERILHKSSWDKIPNYYKSMYKIETGINYFAMKYNLRVTYRQFDYTITIKEHKYNLLKCLEQRISLSKHLFLAHLKYNIYNRWF